jgi:hypothetical protein
MNPQVLTIKTLACAGSATVKYPELFNSCPIDSESTVFLEQPKDIK